MAEVIGCAQGHSAAEACLELELPLPATQHCPLKVACLCIGQGQP
jgi:hypothetical protein